MKKSIFFLAFIVGNLAIGQSNPNISSAVITDNLCNYIEYQQPLERSNKTSSIFNPGGSTASITDEAIGNISLYPNPVQDLLFV